MKPRELLTMYTQHPAALADDVAQVFRVVVNEEDRVKHNVALERFGALIGPKPQDGRRLALNVANAILATAREGVTDGKAADRQVGQDAGPGSA